ncbi:MAG: hypothetical protein MI924_27825 [Chloroflexales bacterium]|nr:hypothetical protein [Chloroflexales bacterium]
MRSFFRAICFWGLICALLSAVSACGNNAETELTALLREHGLQLEDISTYTLEQHKINRAEEVNILAKDQANVLRIKIIPEQSPEASAAFIQDQQVILNSLYTPVKPPYGESSGQAIACDQEFQPQAGSDDFGEYTTLLAGRRYGYGICTADLIAYKATLRYTYCPATEHVFVIEQFHPIQDPSDPAGSNFKTIQCL